MKKIFLILILIGSYYISIAQQPYINNHNWGNLYTRLNMTSVLGIPYGVTPITSDSTTRPGQIWYNTTDSSLYAYTGTTWIKQKGSGGTSTLPAGSNTQIQFNNSGVFGASSNFTWNGTEVSIGTTPTGGSTKLTVNGTIYASGGDVLAVSTHFLGWAGASLIKNTSDGNISLTANNGTAANLNINNLVGSAGIFSNIVAIAGAGTAANQELRIFGTATNTANGGFGINELTNYTVSSGNGTFAGIAYTGIINQSGATGNIDGLLIQPTITSVANFNAIRVNISGVDKFMVDSSGNIFSNRINNITSSNNASVNPSTTGTIISNNLNNANTALTVLKNQGTGLIQDWRFGASAGTSVASIDANGVFLAGIGSTTILDGSGNAFTPKIQVTTPNATIGSIAGMSVGITNGSAIRAGLFADSTHNQLGISWVPNTVAAPFVFRNSLGEVMRMTSTSHLLIGTTTDNGIDQLQVAGNVTVSSSIRVVGGIINLVSANNSQVVPSSTGTVITSNVSSLSNWPLTVTQSNNGNSSAFRIISPSSRQVLSIDSGGNIISLNAMSLRSNTTQFAEGWPTSGGSVTIGGATSTPIARLQLPASTTTVPTILITPGTLVATPTSALAGSLMVSSVDSGLYYINGVSIRRIDNQNLLVSGTLIGSGNGALTTITIPHGLTNITTTSVVIVQANNSASAGIQYATIDATNIYITYTVAPIIGTNNLSYSYYIK